MNNKEFEFLFAKHSVPTNISFLAKVQTLISKHNYKYDYIMQLYNDYMLKADKYYNHCKHHNQ